MLLEQRLARVEVALVGEDVGCELGELAVEGRDLGPQVGQARLMSSTCAFACTHRPLTRSYSAVTSASWALAMSS